MATRDNPHLGIGVEVRLYAEVGTDDRRIPLTSGLVRSASWSESLPNEDDPDGPERVVYMLGITLEDLADRIELLLRSPEVLTTVRTHLQNPIRKLEKAAKEEARA